MDKKTASKRGCEDGDYYLGVDFARMTLSDKIIIDNQGRDMLFHNDVKEFIKELKGFCSGFDDEIFSTILVGIDKLAGDKLNGQDTV